jgi:hypothetical protein
VEPKNEIGFTMGRGGCIFHAEKIGRNFSFSQENLWQPSFALPNLDTTGAVDLLFSTNFPLLCYYSQTMVI